MTTIYTDRFELCNGGHYPIQTTINYDITVKGGKSPYAPTWDMVMGFKNGRISWESYVRQYELLLRGREEELDEAAREILATGRDVVLLCFCRDPYKCHRSLAAMDLQARMARIALATQGNTEWIINLEIR